MADVRRGLGRGLSALLGEAEDETAAAGAPSEGARELPIDLVHANPEQPRRRFEEVDLAELEASIRDKGVLQPILVRPSPHTLGSYEIVAGERRWRAAQRAGLTGIPALVRDLGDDRALEIAIVENVQRTDLNAMEEARAYQALMHRFAYTQDKAAAVVGKSRSHVANTLRLLQLPDSVQEHLLEGRLTPGHARAVMTAADPAALADRIVARGLSVREAEALAKGEASARPRPASRRRDKDADTAALEADIEDLLGMPVDIADRGGAGEVRVRYQSLEQLDEICRRLTRR